jgi:hypothetical protein
LPPSATGATETAELLAPTTASPPSSDAVNACVVGGVEFGDGEDVPVENSCQESCSCSSGDLLCVLRKCPDKPPSFLRCAAVRNSTDQCCPTYECREYAFGMEFFLSTFSLAAKQLFKLKNQQSLAKQTRFWRVNLIKKLKYTGAELIES